MDKAGSPTNLEELLDQIRRTAEENKDVSLEKVMGFLGRRTFGPFLLLAGLITLAPVIGDIPGVPTMMGIFIFLIAIQLLTKRESIWLPNFLKKRSVSNSKVHKALKWAYPPARFVDRFLRPRLKVLTNHWMNSVVALLALAISLVLPIMEVIPFSANIAGVALTAYGLGVISRDGVLVLIAHTFTLCAMGLIIYNFL